MTAIVVVRSAKRMNFGRAVKIAVLDVHYRLATDPYYRPAVTTRSRGVLRILAVWDKVNVGKTEKSASHRVKREAEALALAYNSAGDQASADLLISTGSA